MSEEIPGSPPPSIPEQTQEERLASVKARMRERKSPRAPSMAGNKEQLETFIIEFVERAWQDKQAIPMTDMSRRFNKQVRSFCNCSVATYVDELQDQEKLYTFMQGTKRTYVVPFDGYAELIAEAESMGTSLADLHAQMTKQLDIRKL